MTPLAYNDEGPPTPSATLRKSFRKAVEGRREQGQVPIPSGHQMYAQKDGPNPRRNAGFAPSLYAQRAAEARLAGKGQRPIVLRSQRISPSR